MNLFLAKNERIKKLDQLLSFEKYEKLLEIKPENYWVHMGEVNALRLFKEASERVPAYKDFLKKNKIQPHKIKTIADFGLLPATDKENYIHKYPLADRCWDGDLGNVKLIASSSGTSGNTNYWPRSFYQEYEATITHELLLKHLFRVDRLKTLVIVGFPMGVYVSGMATSLPLWMASQKYELSIISPGNNKIEVLKAVKNLGKNFDQILLIGHPFFIKDVLETGNAEGINWNENKISMMFCSEGFTENWREYVLQTAGIKSAAAFNTYGSSEMLLMAYETPLSITIRKLLEKNSGLAKNLLGTTQVPNLFQYNPALRYIEKENKELLFTSFSGIPLVRFNLHDSGTVIPYNKIVGTSGVHSHLSWQLPFLTVEGRNDYTVIFYAANIYPQHIHAALSHKHLLSKVTGKFNMSKGYRKNMDEYLDIHIELLPRTKFNSVLIKKISRIVYLTLKEINSEFKDATNRFGNKTLPIVKLWPYGHPKYFKAGLKPKYITAT